VRADIPLAGGRRNERPRGLPPSRYFKALTFHASGQVVIRLLSDRHRTRRITPLGAMAEATPHPPRPVSLVNRAGRGSLRWGIPSSGCRGRTLGFRLHEHSPRRCFLPRGSASGKCLSVTRGPGARRTNEGRSPHRQVCATRRPSRPAPSNTPPTEAAYAVCGLARYRRRSGREAFDVNKASASAPETMNSARRIPVLCAMRPMSGGPARNAV